MLLISFGTRPEYIKIKPLLKELEGIIPYKLCFTGQHIDLLKDVQTDYILEIKDGENRLNSIVASILNYEHIFQDIQYTLIHGDTASALALALNSFHHQIPVIHLEAGLRTYDLTNPFPEELNRQLCDRIASILLAPTEQNKQNLLDEKIPGKIYVTGNTGLDNLLPYKDLVEYTNEVIVTLHRRENHSIINQWFFEIEQLAINNPDLKFILPIHPNPNVQKYKHLLQKVKVIPPLPYEEMLQKLLKCRFFISDSGGIQEEASFLNKKVIVCRKTTERPESLEKHSFLCKEPVDLKEIFSEVNKNYQVNYPCPFGDGFAAQKIVKILKNDFFNSSSL